MRWENGIDLLPHHLARLERTAAAMGYSYPVSEIVRVLDALNRELQVDDSFVVRLLLGPGGTVRIQTKPVGPALSRPYQIGLARGRVTSLNPFAHLKTTFRSVYENGRIEAAERGLDEIIYLNERDELTEGTITNVFLKLDGVWVTPPLSSGVLPGIARQLMLESSQSPEERVLTADDLFRAEKILLTNAVRGSVDAVLETNAAYPQNYP
jgi:para-aminobenzoate synthetase/4-amino-4-deoxychorismate lyase